MFFIGAERRNLIRLKTVNQLVADEISPLRAENRSPSVEMTINELTLSVAFHKKINFNAAPAITSVSRFLTSCTLNRFAPK